MVLDLGNPQVQDFVFNVVDELMTNYPEIDYIKWDANMSILNHGSNYLGKDEQSHLYIAYHRGLEKCLQANPDEISRADDAGMCQWWWTCQLWTFALL